MPAIGLSFPQSSVVAIRLTHRMIPGARSTTTATPPATIVRVSLLVGRSQRVLLGEAVGLELDEHLAVGIALETPEPLRRHDRFSFASTSGTSRTSTPPGSTTPKRGSADSSRIVTN